ncbi:MAG TPA: hypothetical protein VIH61_06635 [Waddliaceae bacterium]
MDIRTVSQEEKDKFIHQVLEVFGQIRNMLNTLEIDMQKEDLMIQASAVWISGNLANWYYDFIKQIREIEKQKDQIQQQIMDAASENSEK